MQTYQGFSRYVRRKRGASTRSNSKVLSEIVHRALRSIVKVRRFLADADQIFREAVNRNGRLHYPELHIGTRTTRLTLDTTGTCCACCSASTATPYSPSDLVRAAIAVAVAADETVAVAASSAITPRLLTYRGIKNIRIAQKWPPPPPLLVARHDFASSSRAAGVYRYRAEGKRKRETRFTSNRFSILLSRLLSYASNFQACAR